MLEKNISILPITTLLLTLTLSSHASIEPFGVVEDINADQQIEQEVLENEEGLREFEESFPPIEEFNSEQLLTLNISSPAPLKPFGLVEDIDADQQIEQEVLENKKELREFEESSAHIKEFKPEKGTFLEEEYVEPEPEITYKYDDDSKFYHEDELPENKGRLGNIVIQVPDSMSKEEAISQVESEGIGS